MADTRMVNENASTFYTPVPPRTLDGHEPAVATSGSLRLFGGVPRRQHARQYSPCRPARGIAGYRIFAVACLRHGWHADVGNGRPRTTLVLQALRETQEP